MNSWWKFYVLWMLTGSPVAALGIMAVLWAVADWYTLGFLRRGWRTLNNVRRGFRLAKELALNPHNRKARIDLGEILVDQRRHEKAIGVLKPALDADHGDLHALYSMGRACLGAGRTEQGELFLKTVAETDPHFRMGGPWLEIGRNRLTRADGKGAIEALTLYLQERNTSVEGHYLIARAYDLEGDLLKAAKHRDQAWLEYDTSLPYQQREERYWAWRTRPSRPLTYLVVGALLAVGVGYALRGVDLGSLARRGGYGAGYNASSTQDQGGDDEP